MQNKLSRQKGYFMKKIISGLLSFILVVGLGSNVLAKQDENGDLLGVISKEQLQMEPFATWYNESDQAYTVDEAAVAELDAMLQGVNIKIVMGTWCHDSKREVPRFYKILSTADADQNMVEMIAVDRKKQLSTGEIDGLGLTNTPTFIFYRDGEELNRIVETPVESLEKDMMKILKGDAYRHSKLPAEDE